MSKETQLIAVKPARNRQDDADIIRAWLLDKTGTLTLSEKQTEHYERLRQAWSMLTDKLYSREQTTAALMKLYAISEATAYRDVRESINLFGDATRAEKEGLRYVVYEAIMKTYQLALKKEDLKTAAKCTQNMIRVLGLDKEDADVPDFTRLQPSMFAVVIDDPTRQLIHGLLNKGSGAINLSTVAEALYGDAEDAQILDNEDDNDPGTDPV